MPVTWDPNNVHDDIALSNGDLTATWTRGDLYNCHGKGNNEMTSGKFYWEVLIGSVPNVYGTVGVAQSGEPLTDDYIKVGYGSNGQLYHDTSVTGSWGDAYEAADVIGVAFDADAGKIWFAKNNVWQASGDPANGTDEAYSGLTGGMFPAITFRGDPPDSAAVTGRFLPASWSYSPPSGFSRIIAIEDIEISEGMDLADLSDHISPDVNEDIHLDDSLAVGWEANAYLPGGAYGGFDANAVSLLHFDGPDESTTFTDETGKIWTPHGNVQLDTSQKKFGSAAGLFDGSGAYVTTPAHADFSVGTGDFTIECFFECTSLIDTGMLFAFYDGGGQISMGPNGSDRAYFNVPGWGISQWLGSGFFSVDSWYHMAVVRFLGETKFYIDGAEKASTATAFNFENDSINYIGRNAIGSYFQGHIDEFRFSNVARWTANFTPPDARYTDPTQPHCINLNAAITAQIQNDVSTSEDFTVADDISVERSKNFEIAEGVSLDDAMTGKSIRYAEIDEGLGLSDGITAIGAQEVTINEGVALSEEMIAVAGDLDEKVTLDDEILATGSEFGTEIAETIELDDAIDGVEVDTNLAETIELSESLEGYKVADRSTSEDVDLADTMEVDQVYGKTMLEQAQIWEDLGFTWNMTVEETLNISETVIEELAWKIKESLIASESVSNLWSGVVTVEDMLEIWGMTLICQVFNETAAEALTITDTATFIHKMISTVAESLGISEVVTPSMTYNPEIVEALGVTAAMTAIRTLNVSNEESVEISDVLAWQWQESIAESLTATDTAAVAFHAILALTENLTVTETVLQNLQVDETLADALEIVASLTAQFKFNLAVEDTLTISLSVLLDDEVWECWVLNGNAFHPSVYSGFDFNSYAVFGNTAYGCKDDGIYELTGDNDQGTAITAGIVLPSTYFGTQRIKKFRKAYFGLSGGTTPSLRVETDSGSKTYTISDSKADMTRDMYGRQWVLKLQDFESIEFVELWPVILTR